LKPKAIQYFETNKNASKIIWDLAEIFEKKKLIIGFLFF
jgi:hypothetical protein